MTYEEAKVIKNQLEEKNNAYSKILQTFEKNEIGLTPDHIRELPEWKEANNEFKTSFAQLRKFNSWYVKTFKKEIQADRRNRYKKK